MTKCDCVEGCQLADRFTPATRELMVFTKNQKRYFDLDAVRESYKAPERIGQPMDYQKVADSTTRWMTRNPSDVREDRGGAPPLDWWNIPEGEAPQLRRPCEHGRYDEHGMSPFGKPSSHRPTTCPGGEFLAADLHAPLNWWNIPLLEGEEETRYGPKEPPKAKNAGPLRSRAAASGVDGGDLGAYWAPGERMELNPIGAPPLDWWNIPPGGYEGAHYAVFPPELCIKPIKAMCPEKVCRVCGEPSRRIVESDRIGFNGGQEEIKSRAQHRTGGPFDGGGVTRVVTAESWSDCGHDDYRPGLVLDPFGGSGTTALVATGHGRDCVLIDLDERNFALALERVGPFILERAG